MSLSGEWLRVLADEYWDLSAADLICSELGFQFATSAEPERVVVGEDTNPDRWNFTTLRCWESEGNKVCNRSSGGNSAPVEARPLEIQCNGGFTSPLVVLSVYALRHTCIHTHASPVHVIQTLNRIVYTLQTHSVMLPLTLFFTAFDLTLGKHSNLLANTANLILLNNTKVRNPTRSAICDTEWSLIDATVACQQLGFAGAEEASHQRHRLASNKAYKLRSPACRGDEDSLDQCGRNVWRREPCTNKTSAAVRCISEANAHIDIQQSQYVSESF